MRNEFGTSHVYNCDTFNEMMPSSNDPAYLRSVGAAIFGAMVKADPNATWWVDWQLIHCMCVY